jgi:hypothetical protein
MTFPQIASDIIRSLRNCILDGGCLNLSLLFHSSAFTPSDHEYRFSISQATRPDILDLPSGSGQRAKLLDHDFYDYDRSAPAVLGFLISERRRAAY